MEHAMMHGMRCDAMRGPIAQRLAEVRLTQRHRQHRPGADHHSGRCTHTGLQNAMTSSEEHVSRSRGLPHREGTDGLRRPPF